MLVSLEDRTVLVTGASTGIGRATAQALADRGANVVACARNQDALTAVIDDLPHTPGKHLAIGCDVSDRNQVGEMVDQTVRTYETVYGLVNAAGVMPLGPFVECRMDDWDHVVDVNIKGVLHTIGHLLPHFLSQQTGHIVNISSIAGHKVMPTAAVYCATKFAVHAISEGLRSELSKHAQSEPHTIRVTEIAPGLVETELRHSITHEKTKQQVSNWLAGMKNPLQSEDVARSICQALEEPQHVGINQVLLRPIEEVH